MARGEAGFPKGSVLIVEDEDVLRMTFEEFLTEEGYTVHPTGSYEQALAVLDSQPVDVVVSDIILGGNTGMDLLKVIHDRDLGCKVVMITGDPSLATASEAVRLSAFDYLAKPVNGSALLRVVRQAMERKTIEDERDRYRCELDAIFHSVAAGVLTVDLQMNIQQANTAARQMLELPEDVVGTSLLGVPADRVELLEALKLTASSGSAVTEHRLDCCNAAGQHRVYMITTAPLQVGRQRTGAVAVLRDVTRLMYLEERLDEARSSHDIVGRSTGMKEVYRFIDDLSDTDATVLILGESGTGKELVAAAIHHTSRRAGRPMVKVNCSALAEDVLESELFGHVRGAFTGAIKDRIGRFEAANGGTLFLDEIGDISPRLQMRLLRVLQEGEFERLGESKTIHVDVRIIAATNRDLLAKIRAGEFREDLYYRLNVVRVELPALRDREGDVPALVEHFIQKFNRNMRKNIAGVSPEAMAALVAYSWPGNVRELENCIERGFVVCREAELQPRHLPQEIVAVAPPATISAPRAAAVPGPTASVTDTLGSERDQILQVLQDTDWNIAKASRRLGISRNTLYHRIDEYKLERPD